jgi:hypothetical protein
MMYRLLPFVLGTLILPCLHATGLAKDDRPVSGVSLDYYLPVDSADYAPDLKTPAEILGFQIGDRHILHLELVGYFRYLAEQSDRVTLEPYGQTHGGRPHFLAVITAPANHQRMDQILEARKAWISAQPATRKAPPGDLPVVINMGYGIHGNEPSGTNAALLIAYHLAAARNAGTREMLKDTVILIDPCLNPEGLDRFANWTNNHRGRHPNPDSQDREHQEHAPNGRTNYYWFDLNRDWLPLVHPGSQGRIDRFHRWKPNVLLDFHEMETGSTYFFQPGIQSRTHPLTPERNQELTAEFAEFHARALDSLGSLYYTEERFDDFYMGKGSTFPDLHGCIGILFEQASSRGQVQDTQNGSLTFPFSIRNQVATSFSSLEATQAYRERLLRYQQEFFRESRRLAEAHPGAGWLFHAPHDIARLRAFRHLLHRHRIESVVLGEPVEIGQLTFPAQTSLFVPAGQQQYRYLRALFDTPVTFEDPIFYDVSTWNLPLAFNLDWAPVDPAPRVSPQAKLPSPASTGPSGDTLAYLVDYRGHGAIPLAFRLLEEGIDVRVGMEAFAPGPEESFPAGTLMIPLGIQPEKQPAIDSLLARARREGDVRVVPLATGLTVRGIDLGSREFKPLQAAKVGLLMGPGISTYRTGEFWHYFDQKLHQPLTLLDLRQGRAYDFSPYTALILPSSNPENIPLHNQEALVDWVRKGGILIAQGSAGLGLGAWDLLSAEALEPAEADPEERLPYGEARRRRDLEAVNGAILKTEADLTHPLNFGYTRSTLPVFTTSNRWWALDDNPYVNPLVYADPPLLSGYASTTNQEAAAGSAAALVKTFGRGRVVLIRDNPLFRGFFTGHERTLANAILLGHLMETPAAP